MAEHDSFPLETDYYNGLYVKGLSSMLDRPTACYKFYWLEAIIRLIRDENTDVLSFDNIVDEMIANAWYTVREYHLHLSGKVASGEDALEQMVRYLPDVDNSSVYVEKSAIKEKVKAFNNDKTFLKYKKNVIGYVPSRALAGFYDHYENQYDGEKINRDVSSQNVEQTKKVNTRILLPYIFNSDLGLQRSIVINRDWKKFIQANYTALLGWVQFEKTKWLQKVNPDVPNVVSKLFYTEKPRNGLAPVRRLWDSVLERKPLYDIGGFPIDVSDYHIDHFIPWSFVMDDELWNLSPITPALNSSKSNYLPSLDVFFKPFANNLYTMYCMNRDYPEVHKNYEACCPDFTRSSLNAELFETEIDEEKFFEVLQKNMISVYDAAKRQDFDPWPWKPENLH